MKYLFIFILGFFFISGCNFNNNTAKTFRDSTDEVVRDTLVEDGFAVHDKKKQTELSNKECDEYLKRYKMWLFRYVKVRLEFDRDQNDEEATQLYRELVREGELLGDPNEYCGSLRRFQDSLARLDEIADMALRNGVFDESLLN